jgi:hypothetical protein
MPSRGGKSQISNLKQYKKEQSMFTQTVINVAVLTYFSLSSVHGLPFNLHVGKNVAGADYRQYVTSFSASCLDGAAAPNVEEKVVLRESTLGEKCGLDLEKVARPDPEIAALQADAGRFKSALGICHRAQKTTWETPNLHTVPLHWNEQFSVRWEDDGGYYFGGKHFPREAPDVCFGSTGLRLSQEFDR